ncbi:MAG TPA: hypothetical protein VLC30_17815 [Pseudomonas sp.]|nr:hypothetical protein [Pseudomonas sp.]
MFLNPGFATENFWLGYSTYLGGCAMVRLHTYAAGLDFAERGGKDQQARVFRLVDEQQARCLLLHMDDGGKSQDFRHFGAMQHPRQRRYEFTIDTLLR